MVVQLPPKTPRPVVKSISVELDEIDAECRRLLAADDIRSSIRESRKWVDLARRGGLIR